MNADLRGLDALNRAIDNVGVLRGANVVRDIQAEARAALASLSVAQGQGWLPIESAPKYGLIVDLWANGQRYPNVAWCNIGRCWRKVNRDGRTWAIAPDVVPTHWRHIPDAPAAPAQPDGVE